MYDYFNRPDIARFYYGWFMWSSGLDGIIPNAYFYNVANPYNTAGIHRGSRFLTIIPQTIGGYSPLPSLIWELTRTGINDIKYIYTLTKFIDKAKQSSNTKVQLIAKEEERRLESILKSMKGGSLAYYDTSGFWDANVYDILRRRVAGSILRLQKALRKENNK